jgi:U3 small nucleolar RNA-associated protein 3
LVLKQALAGLENLDFGPAGSDVSNSSDVGDLHIEGDMANFLGWPGFRTMLEDDELTELLRDAQLQSPEPIDLDHPKEKKRKGKEREKKEEGKKQKKEKKVDQKSKGVYDLVEPDFVPSSSKHKPSASATPAAELPLSLSAYGESTALDAIDAEDKSARKRSLRFHMSKIESTAARRAHARHAASGGDDDIPYRERNKEREARLKREAEAKLKKGLLGQGGDDLEDVEMEDGGEDEKGKGKKRRREEMEEDDDDAGGDGYYELVKRQKKDKKEKKKAEYDAEKAAERYAPQPLWILIN